VFSKSSNVGKIPKTTLLTTFIGQRRTTTTQTPNGYHFSLVSVSEILSILNIQPPAGVSWSGNSLRSGGATAAYSIGVDTLIVKRFNMWKCLSSAQVYIDVLALPDTPSGFFSVTSFEIGPRMALIRFSNLWRGHDLSLARYYTWRAHSNSPMVDITFVRCLSTTRVPRVEFSSQVDNADNINEPCPNLV